MLWVILAQHGLADPTVCEGREPVEGFPVGLEFRQEPFVAGSVRCDSLVSQNLRPETIPDRDDVRSGPDTIGVDSSV